VLLDTAKWGKQPLLELLPPLECAIEGTIWWPLQPIEVSAISDPMLKS